MQLLLQLGLFQAEVLQIRRFKRKLQAKMDRPALERSLCEVEQIHH